jgi:hypothetical protein
LKIIAQGILGYSATMSRWEMATRGGHGEGEGLMLPCSREILTMKGVVAGSHTLPRKKVIA